MLKKIFSSLLVSSLVFTSTFSVFAEDELIEKPETSTEAGWSWSLTYGVVEGHQDYINGEKNDPKGALRKLNTDFKKNFEIDNEDRVYIEEFTTTFKRSYIDFYEWGYSLNPPDAEVDYGKPESATQMSATELGGIWGTVYGNYDGHKNRIAGGTPITNNVNRDISKFRNIDLHEWFLFDTTKSGTEDDFKIAFEGAYRSAYHYGVSGLPIAYVVGDYQNETLETMAVSIGNTLGAKYAFDDYHAGKMYDYETALRLYKFEHDFITEHGFDKIPDLNIGNLEIGFSNGFMDGYSDTYFSLVEEFANKNVTTLQIGPSGFSTTIDSVPKAGINSNAITQESYTSITIEVPENSAYGEQYIDVYEVENSFLLGDRYLPIKSMFYVGGHSNYNGVEKDSVTLLNDWTISFPFTGSYRVGIYKKDAQKWVYQPTEYDGTEVTLTIPAGEYTEGEYAVIIDNGYVELNDIYSNWAFEELFVFSRRDNLLYDDSYEYKPNDYISRIEVAYMLMNSLYDGYNSTLNTELPFYDLPSSNFLNDAVRFSYVKGYINGTSENTYDPYGHLTYAQFETILSRVLGYEFTLDETFEKMKQDKFYKSKGEDDRNSFITKSEVVYTLYSIWK